jgi:hypothetical protein
MATLRARGALLDPAGQRALGVGRGEFFALDHAGLDQRLQPGDFARLAVRAGSEAFPQPAALIHSIVHEDQVAGGGCIAQAREQIGRFHVSGALGRLALAHALVQVIQVAAHEHQPLVRQERHQHRLAEDGCGGSLPAGQLRGVEAGHLRVAQRGLRRGDPLGCQVFVGVQQ